MNAWGEADAANAWVEENVAQPANAWGELSPNDCGRNGNNEAKDSSLEWAKVSEAKQSRVSQPFWQLYPHSYHRIHVDPPAEVLGDNSEKTDDVWHEVKRKHRIKSPRAGSIAEGMSPPGPAVVQQVMNRR